MGITSCRPNYFYLHFARRESIRQAGSAHLSQHTAIKKVTHTDQKKSKQDLNLGRESVSIEAEVANPEFCAEVDLYISGDCVGFI